MTIRATMPGTAAANAQRPQLMSIFKTCLESTAISGLAAMAVMNMAEVMQLHWNWVAIRYEPMRRLEVPSGSD